MQVLVRDNNVDQALKALKKKMQREGIFREMKLRGHYEKPSEKKAREKAEAVRRARKLARKKLQREGLLPMKPKPVFGAGPGSERGGRRRPRRSRRRAARHALSGSFADSNLVTRASSPRYLLDDAICRAAGYHALAARALCIDGFSNSPAIFRSFAARPSRLRADPRGRDRARRLLDQSWIVVTGV